LLALRSVYRDEVVGVFVRCASFSVVPAKLARPIRSSPICMRPNQRCSGTNTYRTNVASCHTRFTVRELCSSHGSVLVAT
jgi:hypothetical protein